MKHATSPPASPAISRAGYRAALLNLFTCMLLALVALASNVSAQTPPKVSMMPSYTQNPTYANAAINEPIQVWGRVSGGSGTYTNYHLDFGDGTSESFGTGPQVGPASVDSITFEMLDTCSSGTYTFYLNGVLLGSTPANPSGNCTCGPPLVSFTVNNPALLANWLPSSATNTIRIDVAGGQYVAWARANIVSGATTQTAYMINGGIGTAGNGNMDLCAAGYRTLAGQSFSNGSLYAPTVGGGGFAIEEGPDFIKKDHVYTTGGSKTVTLTVTDSAGTAVSNTAVIRVLQSPTHDDRVNMAIEKGLVYLYRTQVRHGAPVRSYWTSNNNEYGNGATGAAVMAFAENGHLASNDPVADVYAETVQRGIYQAVSLGRNQVIGNQTDGNPDTNSNGRGINFSPNYVVYDGSFMLMGIINAFPDAATAAATAIPAGLWAGGGTAPANFHDFVVDGLDCFYWCQADSGLKGWYYTTSQPSQGIDGSTHQWPGIAILTAKERWGIVPPAWVITNSSAGFVGLQYLAVGNALDGAVGYGSNSSWRNSAKTGGALMGFYLGGKLVDADDNATRARNFLARNWYSTQATGSGGDFGGWDGELYAMFGMKKGLLLQEVTTLTTPDNVVHDWYQEMSAWLLGNATLLDPNIGPGGRRIVSRAFGQKADGSWNTTEWPIGGVGSIPLVTAHAILVLTKSVTIPLPVAVVAAIPDQSSRFPAAFVLDGSGSYHQSTNSTIVEYLWDLDASDGLDWNSPDAVGRITSANPGWSTPGNRTVTLRVKDDAATPNYATATTVVRVVDTDVAPVAVPIPAAQLPAVYTGPVGGTIMLDGSESFDPEGDPITGYAWDLDGNGTFGDAADAAKDTSGNGAHGVTASIVFTAEYNGQIGLRVTSTPPNGVPKSSNNTTTIDVQAATSDLFVASITASNLVIGASTDLQVVLQSVATSGKDANSVVVRFYDGNPLTTGNVIGSSVTISIPKGTSQVVSVTGLPLSPGLETVWVYVDATAIFSEFNENNNTANVNVSNKPPVAVAKNVTASAGADCSAAASINDGSSDPDAGDSITLAQVPAGPYPIGTTNVTLTVTDSHGATNSATAQVTVIDATRPVISGCPENIVVQTGAGRATCDQVATWTAPTATDCSAVTIQATHSSGDTFPVGTTTVSYTATDAFNNTATCSFTVTVEDTTPPAVPVLADVTGECSATIPAAPTTTDNCLGTVTGTTSDLLSRETQGTSVVTWSFNDGHGNVVTATQNIIVKDTKAPVIPVLADVTGQCSATIAETPTTTDGCAGTITGTTSDDLTRSTQGTSEVTWSFDDGHGNVVTAIQNIIVKDTEAPVIPVLADVTGECSATIPAAPEAIDGCAGTITGTTSDSLTRTEQGTSVVTWSFDDGHGNVVTATQNIIVKDTEAPAIPVLADVTGQCSATIPAAPTTTDDCAGTITGTTGDSLTRTEQGTSVVTWSFDDGHGNVVTATQNIIIADTLAPVISCPPAASVAFGAVPTAATTTALFIAQGGAIADNCDSDPSVTSVDAVAGLCPTVVTRTYTVTDAVGNASTCVQTITVNNLFAGDGVLWHQPIARNGASDDTDPGAGGTLKYRFKLGSSIPIQIHAKGCSSDVTANSNVTGKVVVFGDTDLDGVIDAGELALDIAFNGVGGAGGAMDKIGGFLKYNLNTKVLPVTLKCYILQVTVTDTSTGESRVETVPLQVK